MPISFFCPFSPASISFSILIRPSLADYFAGYFFLLYSPYTNQQSDLKKNSVNTMFLPFSPVRPDPPIPTISSRDDTHVRRISLSSVLVPPSMMRDVFLPFFPLLILPSRSMGVWSSFSSPPYTQAVYSIPLPSRSSFLCLSVSIHIFVPSFVFRPVNNPAISMFLFPSWVSIHFLSLFFSSLSLSFLPFFIQFVLRLPITGEPY